MLEPNISEEILSEINPETSCQGILDKFTLKSICECNKLYALYKRGSSNWYELCAKTYSSRNSNNC